MECNAYNHQNIFATANIQSSYDFSQKIPNQTIINQDMDDSISKWLHYLKLHKYQWFFNDLSYHEIEFLNEDNIEGFIIKVNKNTITKGARKKICVSTTTLRERQQHFQDLLMVF